MGHFSPFKGRTGPAAAVSRAQISCPLWQQEVTSHRQEEGRSWQEMDDLLGAAFYRNTTSKCVYRLSSAEAFYKHNVNAALHQSERSEEGRGGKRREEETEEETTGNQRVIHLSVILLIKSLSSSFCCFVYHFSECLPSPDWSVIISWQSFDWASIGEMKVCVCEYLLSLPLPPSDCTPALPLQKTHKKRSPVYIREMMLNLHQHAHKHLYITIVWELVERSVELVCSS